MHKYILEYNLNWIFVRFFGLGRVVGSRRLGVSASGRSLMSDEFLYIMKGPKPKSGICNEFKFVKLAYSVTEALLYLKSTHVDTFISYITSLQYYMKTPKPKSGIGDDFEVYEYCDLRA